MKGNRQISVRLRPEQRQRVLGYCQEAGYDVSRVVRQALEAYLGSQAGPGAIGGSPRPRLAPPDEIIPLTQRYLGWGDGDLRQHLKKQFCEILAASWVCKKHYARSPGMIELYEAIRPLAHFFGLEDRSV